MPQDLTVLGHFRYFCSLAVAVQPRKSYRRCIAIQSRYISSEEKQ
jgi:hypothetical protein